MTDPNARRISKSIAALLCLSSSTVFSWSVRAQAVSSSILAQTAPKTSALNCRAERQQNQEALLNGTLEQAEQYITIGRLDEASILLVRSLQTIRGIENSAAKVSLLERVVGSVLPDLAYISPLERLVRVVPPQSSQAALAVLSAAYDTTQTMGSGYTASKTRTLTMLANYATRIGQPDRSASILRQALAASNPIQGADFKTIALSGIAEAYINAGQANAAEPILARALQFAQTINSRNPYPKAAALQRIASLYVRINQFDRALKVVRSISIPNNQSATLLTIVNRYSETGQVDRALELLKSIQSADQKAEMLAKIAGRLTAQQPDRAQQLYSEAVSTARSTQNAQAIVTVAVHYVEAGGLVATAEEIVQAIGDAFVKAPAQGMIALAYSKAGQGDRAKALLQQAIATVATINDASQRNSATQQLIEQAIQSGRYDYALQIAQTIQVGEEIPSERVEVLTRITDRAIAAKRYDAALKITTQIPSNFVGNRDLLFLNIARGLAQAGEFDRAQAIAQEPSVDPSFRPKILAAIGAQILQVAGQIDPATALFNQAIALANEIDYPPTKAETLAAIASEYLRINFTGDATQLLKQTITTAQSIKDPSSRSVLLRTIAEQLAAANQYQAALQIATAIPDATERTYTLNQAIEKAVNAGDFSAAVATLDQLTDPVLKTRWLVTVADRYQQLGDRTQAATTLNQAFQIARTIPGAESQTVNVRGGELPLVGEDDQDRGSFLEAIAIKYAQTGQVLQALQVAQLLENRTVRQQLVQRISCYR